MLYLTPASVIYLCQVILTGLIAVYLGWRSFQVDSSRTQLRLAAILFSVTALLLALLWVESSVIGPWRNYARFLNAPVLAVHGIVTLLFLYHVPEWNPRERREALAVIAILVVARLSVEIVFAYQRFHLYAATGEASRSRPLFADLMLLAVVLWVVFVAVRRVRRLRDRAGYFIGEVVLLGVLITLLALVQLTYSAGLIPPNLREVMMSLGAMVTLPLLVLIIFDMLSEPLTLLARLVGVVLVVTLFLVGGISWLLTPSYLGAASGYPATSIGTAWRLLMEGDGIPGLADALLLNEAGQGPAAASGEPVDAVAASATDERSLAARRALHTPMLLLSLVAAFGSAFVVLGVPVLLRRGLFRPLTALLAGVRQVNAGRLDVAVPVHQHDELGQVTKAFNRMVAELRAMVAGLEGRVAERTAELASSEARYRGLVEQIDEVIFRVALPELRIEYISPAVQRALGYPVEIFAASSFSPVDILHPDSVGSLAALGAELRQGKVAPEFEYKVVDSVGQERWIQQWNTAIYDNGRLIAIEGVCRDVTDQKRAEAQLRVQESELAALNERERIGRDLHDGLGQVMGYVNVQSQAASALIEAGQVAQANGILAQLAHIAQDAHADIRRYILDLRLPAAEQSAEAWQSALHRYVQTFSHSYGIDVQLSYPASLSPDPFAPQVGKEILQIVQEALNNVRKHGGVKTAQVVVLQDDGHIVVIVADNGAGFDVDEARQFAAVAWQEGRFGLKIMGERADAIGAKLDVRSAPGAGTQVLVRVSAGAGVASEPAGLTVNEAVQGVRVLLVDDHPLFVDGMRNMLTARGVQVIGVAEDGNQAQELARQLRPDVILMDMNMPRCDGLEATARIKAELPDIKVIMLTVAAEQEVLFKTLQVGASGYLLKSLDSSEFFRLLAEALHGEIVLSQNLAQQTLNEFARRAAEATNGVVPRVAPSRQPADLLLTLSSRQRDILERTARGSTYKEIAAALFISEATVKYHMGQIIELLQVENRREAIALARRAGIG